MKKKFLLAAAICCLVGNLCAQVTLSGKVTDKEYGEPLVGVNIRVDNSLAGSTTNGKGEFSISNLPEGKHVLSFTYVGFTPLHYTAQGSEKNIRIAME